VVWPSGAGKAEVRVSVAGVGSRPVVVRAGAAAPGLFGYGGAAAAPGGLVTLSGTGVRPARVWVGLQAGAVVGVTASADGVQAWRIRIPANAPLGCAVPVTAVSADGVAGNTIALPVAVAGRACVPDAWSEAAGRPGRVGLVVLSTTVQGAVETQEGAALLAARPEGQAWSVPVVGSCGVYRAEEGFNARDSIVAQLTGRLPGDGLDGGSRIVVSVGGQARGLTARSPGFYWRRIEGNVLAGKVMFGSMGGRAVGEFSLQMEAPARFAAVLPGADGVVRRDGGLKLSWSGVAAGRWVVAAVSASDAANVATATAVCLAPGAAGQFTVPAWVLSALPVADSAGVTLMTVPEKPDVHFAARGLDRGLGLAVYSIATVVRLR